ncbi:unnamed protein product [Paramecium pentaurelia]|uniref:Insulin-like growth factor binding protein, N-terminal n=1 Tax=Paramecium pentaurelia TaxID=43138 RepID=A0A8S1S2M3_9CILI|nr:unnamed protein product [Paramecium pentaurelia]
MILFRLAIALLTIQSCQSQSTQWVVTHHEGQDSGFNQFQQDIGLITQCQQANIQIITSNPYIQKTISLRNFKAFAHSLVVIDYLRPQTMEVQIQIQNKTYDPKVINHIYKRSIMDNCLVGDNQYIEQSFVQEIYGNSLDELNIIMMGGMYNNNEFNMASDQKIAIKQIHILQIQCPENCKRCVYLDKETICTLCNDGFESINNGNCFCDGFKQNDICVEKCYDGYAPDYYQICQQTEIIKSINFQQNLRRIYRKSEQLELEFDLENFRTFEIDIEIQIYNFDMLQVFEILMNEGNYVYYLNVNSPNNAINMHEISYRDCETEQFCQIYHFKSKIISIESSKLQFQALLNSQQYKSSSFNQDQNTKITYWKLVNLNINILMTKNEISYFNHCIQIERFGYNDKCIKCQSPFIVLDGQCIQKCPLQLPKQDDMCFDSEIQNTELLKLDEFKNQDYYQNEIYWFYNHEFLFSNSMSKHYRYNNLKTHYGITIQAKILFINYRSDLNVIISINDEQNVIIQNKQEYKNNSDSFVYLNQFIQHNNTELLIQIQSQFDQSYMTNVILLIHQCTPYCKSCTGPKQSECLEYETDLKEFNAITQRCNPGYFKTKGDYCMYCLNRDCLVCSDGLNCQQCKKGCILTKYGQCDCN